MGRSPVSQRLLEIQMCCIGRLWEQKQTREDDNLIEQKCVDVCLKMGRILFFVLGFLVAENIQFFNQ